MAQDMNQAMPSDLSNVEIEPLSDEELESVAGGTDSTDSDNAVVSPSTSTGPSCCSCSGCSSDASLSPNG